MLTADGCRTRRQRLWQQLDPLPATDYLLLGDPVMVGVGAAFDFHTGRVAQAPRWMRENGMEWFFRLISEPRRLWRRYLVNGSEFAWLVMLEQLGLRKF